MINSNAPYSGLSNIMNMRDRNPNTQLAYVPNSYLNSVPTAPNPYTGIPQVNSPIAMNEGGMPSMQYPMQEEAGQLADRGRYGDTTLVHMTPGEVQGLASLGQLTINPDTGLPEAFNMQALLPIIGGIAGSFLLPGIGTALGASALGATAIGAGIGTTAGGLLAGQSFGEAALGGVMSGAMSFGMGSLMGAGDIAGGLQSTADFVPTATAEASIPAATQGLAGQAGEVYGGFDALSGVGEYGGFGYNALPTGISPDQILQAPAGSMIGTADVAPKTLFGYELSSPVVKGQVYNPSELLKMGATPSTATTMDLAKQKLSDPLTYAPAAIGAATGAFDEPYVPPEPEKRKPVDTGYGDYTLAGGTPRKSKTQEELLAMALGGGREKMFEDSYYMRNAAEGGIVGLQQGGMATPQAPSAMSAMLSSPMQQQQQQQPVPVNIAVQPTQQQQPMQQQPMPIQGMSMQGIQPLPDQSIAFKKNMDMEDQLQKERTASSIQGQSALLGLISGGGNYLQSQGMNYPTTTPSGTRPQAPAMNQGTQVNMGASGGFAQGGLLGYNEGGMPSQEQGYFEGQVVGKGDGQSDEVPFKVDSKEIDMAMLSPDEYVLAADVVSYIGDGSSNAGAAKLDQFMVDVRKQAHGSGKQIKGFKERGLANLVA
jgi:hypothetical protein